MPALPKACYPMHRGWHPPLLLREGLSGAVRTLLENGLFLGYFRDVTFSSVEVPFHQSDWVLLYTDGISEMMDPSQEMFGEARLKEFLVEHGAPPAAEFSESLLKRLSAWSGRASGQDPDDDVTLLSVYFKGR